MASTYLQRSIGNGNRKTWTWSAWVKRSRLSTTQILADNYTDASNYAHIYFNGADNLVFYSPPAGTWSWHPVYRDVSAWYHIVLRCDTTLATNSDRVRLYVNGELQSANAVAGINQNQELNFNASSQLRFGARQVGTSDYFDGLIAHAHFTDGYSYAPTEFGETDSTTGIWKPKTSPSVTYGTNGYFLDFANSSDMGNDISGNNNDFTVSGGTMTQTVDTPSNVFAVWNAVAYENAFAGGNGNTAAPGGSSANHNMFVSTLAVSKGKYYFEAEIDAYGGSNPSIGIASYDVNLTFGNYVGGLTGTIGYTGNGNINENGSSLVTGLSSYTDGDIIGVGLDLDNNKIYFYKNGTLENTGGTTITNRLYGFAVSQYGNTGRWYANFGNGYFGQSAVASAGTNSGLGTFEHDVPNGYKALCTKNINAQEYS